MSTSSANRVENLPSGPNGPHCATGAVRMFIMLYRRIPRIKEPCPAAPRLRTHCEFRP